MMDSHDTNLPLEDGKLEEDKSSVEATEPKNAETSEAIHAENKSEAAIANQTIEEILIRLKEIANEAGEVDKQEIDALKQQFYKTYKAEQEAAKAKYLENGGEEKAFVPETNAENEFKAVMGGIKEKRNAVIALLEKQKEDNLKLKEEIVEKLKNLVNNPEEANKSYNEFKKLQQQWNEIKLIPAAKVNELWKSYQLYVEKFYDIIKLNNEFRDYDFRKNLELKTKLCEAAEKLAEENDVVSAFHQLQKLHQEFRETGPVAKELREEVWNRFKAASSVVNRKHQQHFETLKENEQRNLDEKTVICEIVEAVDYNELKSFTEWENKTKEIIALQAKWKTIGFAPQKMNVKIFERFRNACDDFFKRKGEFFKSLKESFNENLEKKRALCEKAESLKENTDWRETSDIFIKLQQEWKSIGPVPKKYSDTIWKRFIGACDFFFEQKNEATSSQRSIETENLEKKKAIIDELMKIDENTEAEEAGEKTRELMREWNSIGHVPFKDKDKIYKQYHAIVDKLFERFHINSANKKLNNYRSNISHFNNQGDKGNSLYREREKLMRSYENMKNEIQTYENNLGFLTSSSKKGNSLVSEMNKKVEKLKSDLELILKKIEVIDESLNKEG